MSIPSLAPAKLRNKNVGFRSSAAAALGNSRRALKAADFDADSCASETLAARISSAPIKKKAEGYKWPFNELIHFTLIVSACCTVSTVWIWVGALKHDLSEGNGLILGS